jgi:membrane protease YdiL (CAAX protease family)
MPKENIPMKKTNNWGKQETFAAIWLSAALILSVLIPVWQGLSLPIFTFIFLTIPLINLLRQKQAQRIGMGRIEAGKILKWSAINLGILILVYAIFEPWSGAYRFLLLEATGSGSTDPTFFWLRLFEGPLGWLGLLLFSGLITIFAEELCFRGWLLRTLELKVGGFWANVLQAAIFTLPQLVVAFLMPSLTMGIVYGLVYSFGAIGMINGWVSMKAGAIWPNLIAASVMNLILSILILGS